MPGAFLLNEVREGQLIQNRLDGALDVAKHLYTRVESSSPMIKYGLDKFDQTTGWISRPLVSKITQLSQPMIQKLDSGLSVTYSTLSSTQTNLMEQAKRIQETSTSKVESVRQSLVNHSWFKKVDAILDQTVHYKGFYSACVESFNKLETKTYADFVTVLKGKIQIWDERLTVPAKVFFNSAMERYRTLDPTGNSRVKAEELFRGVQTIQTKLAQAWNESVKAPSSNAARALYESALQHYVQLTSRVSGSVNNGDANATDAQGEQQQQQQHALTVAELVSSMREKLGHAWNDRLYQPLSELFANFQTVAQKDLTLLREAVSGYVHLPSGSNNNINNNNNNNEVNDAAPADEPVAGRVEPNNASAFTIPTFNRFQYLYDGVEGFVRRRLTDVLEISEKTVDYVLPENDENNNSSNNNNNNNEPAKKSSVAQFSALGGRVSKRLRKKLNTGWGQVRELSSTRLKSIVHVDLIAYAEQVIDKTNKTVEPAIAKLSETYQASYKTAVSKAQTNLDAVKAVANPRLTTLKLRLRDAVSHAREVGQVCVHAVAGCKVMEVHKDVVSLVEQAAGRKNQDPEFQEFVVKVKALCYSLTDLLLLRANVETEKESTASANNTNNNNNDNQSLTNQTEQQQQQQPPQTQQQKIAYASAPVPAPALESETKSGPTAILSETGELIIENTATAAATNDSEGASNTDASKVAPDADTSFEETHDDDTSKRNVKGKRKTKAGKK